jgi:small subunit ribosomal protein S9
MAEEKTKFYGTGKRKTAIAKVYLSPGNGQLRINGRESLDYFHQENLILTLKAPLVLTKTDTMYNVRAEVFGGGIASQAEAVRLGISRALLLSDAGLKAVLKQKGFLTRDARKKERKKYGLRSARARFQFSKR